MKEVIFSKEARDKLLEGVNLVAKAVSATLGPKGRNAVISRDVAPPIITNDGVTIAASFNKVKDPFVNTGVQMIKEVSAKQNGPGDGTTTATVLAAYMVNEGSRAIEEGQEPIKIKEDLEKSSALAIKHLKEFARPIKTKEELIQVATISVEDELTGQLIGEMMHKVGKDGAITVETSKDVKLEKDMAQGMKFDQGFMTPYFMTNPYRQEAIYEDVPIMVTDHTFSTNEEITHIADGLLEKGMKGMVIVCDDMKGEALTTAVTNTINGVFSFLVIRLPGLDEARTRQGEDIAVSVGAKFISKDIDKLSEVLVDDLGGAEKVMSRVDETVIVRGGGKKKDISSRIKELKAEIKDALSDFDRDQLKGRIARLSGGIGVLRVGAATEQELNYKKHKIEDALAATRVAMDGGVVPGGGMALSRAAVGLGRDILARACVTPFMMIIENAGKDPKKILNKIEAKKDKNVGWNAKTDEIVNMFDAGVIDPCVVVCRAIENAVSMAGMFLTSETLIVDSEKKEEDDPMPGGRKVN